MVDAAVCGLTKRGFETAPANATTRCRRGADSAMQQAPAR